MNRNHTQPAFNVLSEDNTPQMVKSFVFKLFERMPLALIFLLTVLGFLLILMRGIDRQAVDKPLKKLDARTLIGMQDKVPTTKPHWTLARFMAGESQRQFEAKLNHHFPFRAAFVRTYNQLFYNLFSKSYMYHGTIVVGKHHYLYEIPYLDKYYNGPNIAFKQKDFDTWLADLQALADFFASRGQKFIYLITPSKAAHFPEYLPPCKNCVRGQIRPDYFLITETLKKARIPYVDGSKINLDAKEKYGNVLFPQGGIHWTILGATLAAQDLVKKIAVATNDPLMKLEFTYKLHRRPKDSDTDLLGLSNLMHPHKHYKVPAVTFLNHPTKNKPLRVAIIGGSFTHLVMTALAKSNMFAQIDNYNYFTISHQRYRPDNDLIPPKFEQIPLDQRDPNTYQDVMNADVVVLEENEANLRSGHFRLVLNKFLNRHYTS